MEDTPLTQTAGWAPSDYIALASIVSAAIVVAISTVVQLMIPHVRSRLDRGRRLEERRSEYRLLVLGAVRDNIASLQSLHVEAFGYVRLISEHGHSPGPYTNLMVEIRDKAREAQRSLERGVGMIPDASLRSQVSAVIIDMRDLSLLINIVLVENPIDAWSDVPDSVKKLVGAHDEHSNQIGTNVADIHQQLEDLIILAGD